MRLKTSLASIVIVTPLVGCERSPSHAPAATATAPIGASSPVDGKRVRIAALEQEVTKLEVTLRDSEETLVRAERDLKATTRPATVEDWARVDPTMEGYVKARNAQQMRYDSLRPQLGDKGPVVQRSLIELNSLNDLMSKYATELNEKFVIRWKEDGTGGAFIPRDLSGFRESVARLRNLTERQREQVRKLKAEAARDG